MPSAFRTATRSDLEVIALSDHEWRVCDARIDDRDPRRLLGYIERQESQYDVLILAPRPIAHGRFDRWEAALQVLRRARDLNRSNDVDGIAIVARGDGPERGYYLEHDFDLDLLDGVPPCGPYESYVDAQHAAQLVALALSGVSD